MNKRREGSRVVVKCVCVAWVWRDVWMTHQCCFVDMLLWLQHSCFVMQRTHLFPKDLQFLLLCLKWQKPCQRTAEPHFLPWGDILERGNTLPSQLRERANVICSYNYCPHNPSVLMTCDYICKINTSLKKLEGLLCLQGDSRWFGVMPTNLSTWTIQCKPVARLHNGQGGTGPLRLMAGPSIQMRCSNAFCKK